MWLVLLSLVHLRTHILSLSFQRTLPLLLFVSSTSSSRFSVPLPLCFEVYPSSLLCGASIPSILSSFGRRPYIRAALHIVLSYSPLVLCSSHLATVRFLVLSSPLGLRILFPLPLLGLILSARFERSVDRVS